MKKNIELDDSLFNSLESIREKFHIKSLTPVISMALTIGIEVLKRQSYPSINTYPMTDTITWPIGDDYTIYAATGNENTIDNIRLG